MTRQKLFQYSFLEAVSDRADLDRADSDVLDAEDSEEISLDCFYCRGCSEVGALITLITKTQRFDISIEIRQKRDIIRWCLVSFFHGIGYGDGALVGVNIPPRRITGISYCNARTR